MQKLQNRSGSGLVTLPNTALTSQAVTRPYGYDRTRIVKHVGIAYEDDAETEFVGSLARVLDGDGDLEAPAVLARDDGSVGERLRRRSIRQELVADRDDGLGRRRRAGGLVAVALAAAPAEQLVVQHPEEGRALHGDRDAEPEPDEGADQPPAGHVVVFVGVSHLVGVR